MAVAAFLPALRAIGQIHAGKNAVVETVEVAVARKDARTWISCGWISKRAGR
jgi:hypothetical protein